MKIDVRSRKGKPLIPGGLTIEPDDTVVELKKAFYRRKPTYYPSRQRFTLPPKKGDERGTVLQDDETLTSYGIEEGSVIHFRDLGPQVGYATVFFWEYLGPLLIYPLFYFFPWLYWWSTGPILHHTIQRLALFFWSFHYTKRLVETFLVHKFSHGTMPLRNLFKNCSYYWGFAAYISYFVNHPLYRPPSLLRAYVLLFVAMICEFSNLYCHIILQRLRKKGEKGYKMPRGFLFEYVTCANYTMETCAWILFSIATQTLTSMLFTLAGSLQMAQWANGKHKRLVQIFDGRDGRPKYPKRWKMIPFLF